MSRTVSIPVAVAVERKAIDNPWQDHLWRPVSVLPGAPPARAWKELRRGEGWTHFLAPPMPLALNPRDAIGYKHNLEGPRPSLYVVLRRAPGEEPPVRVHLVTASPYEAGAYTESGEEIVEPVAMPEAVAAWIGDYVAKNYVEETFYKRQRDKGKGEEHMFGKEPIFVTRRRMERNSNG